MRRTRFTCLIWIAAGLAVVDHSYAGLRYSLTPLLPSITGNAMAVVNDINDAGVAVGMSRATQWTSNSLPNDQTSSDRATLWGLDALPIPLATNAGSTHGHGAQAINERGDIVGYHVYLGIRPASFTAGPWTPAGAWEQTGVLRAINDNGVAVGEDGQRPIRFANGTVTFIGGPNARGRATAIDSDDAAFGVARTPSNYDYAAGFSETAMPNALGPVAPPPGISALAAINRHGAAVGWSRTSDAAEPRAMQWQNGVVTVLTADWTDPQPPFIGAGKTGHLATSINDQGWIVGREGRLHSSKRDGMAFLISDGHRVLVNDLLSAEQSAIARVAWATGINNRGQIIAEGSWDHDNDPVTARKWTSFRLDPIRTPGDTNADDLVNFDDLLTLAQNYGRTGNGDVFYETGDFNYDWQVGFDDLLVLAQHYEQPASFASDWALATSLVPEPTAAIGLGVAALVVRRRRRGE